MIMKRRKYEKRGYLTKDGMTVMLFDPDDDLLKAHAIVRDAACAKHPHGCVQYHDGMVCSDGCHLVRMPK